jgi:hypothetical protein
MIVEATYVLCTTSPHMIEEREARHRDKVFQILKNKLI